MNIVIAPDSFKGSLTSAQAANTMRKAILEISPDCDVHMKPMADGGEGTLDALFSSSDDVRVPVTCAGPLGETISTSFGIVNKTTAIIECASIAGLTQVPEDKRNPDWTTSFGIGEVIKLALDKGCTSFVLGLGGSATNDGGFGMLQALGMKAWNKNGVELGPRGQDLLQVAKVSFVELEARLTSADIKVACDVDNPLCGDRGASAVYGPQKGATPEQVKQYDQALRYFGGLVEAEVEKEYQHVAGAGAAGGLGFALLAVGAELVSGATLIAEAANLKESVKHADLVLTGEGQSDEQTLYGKAPGYVADLAAAYDVPTVLISGSLTGDANRLREKFAGCFSIINQPLSLEACMRDAEELLFEQTKQVIHFWSSI
ncbi:glycerate kinase [Lentibacillus sp. N15]|uniref:glycerate kinase n=1 Tax=Lentibacillus songyuanensis TaxID=3136161 RepID=UPI0031BA36A5